MNTTNPEYNHTRPRATVRRLLRPARRICTGLALALCLALAPSCWNVVGHRLELSAPALLEAALDAEQRGDRRAARTLLGRLAAEHDGTPEAEIARGLLATLPPDQGSADPAPRE